MHDGDVRTPQPVILSALVLALGACDRSEPKAEPVKPVAPAPATPPATSPATSIETKSAAVLLRGTWQVEGFEAAAPAGSSSAAALQAEASTDEAQAVRITYTGDQIQIHVPGQPVLSSSYEVKESHPTWCRILNGKDEVVITFRDDDHMTVDRKGNAYGAKMKMRRASGPPPVAAAAPAASGSAAPKIQVVGKSASGNTIVKIGP